MHKFKLVFMLVCFSVVLGCTSTTKKDILQSGTHRSEIVETLGKPESSGKNSAGFKYDIFKLTAEDLNPEKYEMGFWDAYLAGFTLGLSTLLTEDEDGEQSVKVKVTYDDQQRVFNTQYNKDGRWVSSSEI